ncbi:MAG: thiolase [Burkholderiales bacterium]|nr:thiolase [Burkholderiales bacterium]
MKTERFPRGRTAIVSAVTHGIGEAPGLSSLDLAAIASTRALRAIGLTPLDVDGVFVGLSDDYLSGLSLTEYLGMDPRVTDCNRTGGSSFQTHVIHAALALEAGQCDVALIAYGSNQRTGSGKLVSAMRQSPYEQAFRLARPIGGYALAASRYQALYGLKKEQLGSVAIASRQWAQRNPDAFMREALSMEDYLAARLVADPFSVRDCCLVTDGAGAIVMVRAERAKDLAARPVFVLGGAAAVWHKDITNMPELTVTAASVSGPRAMAHAGITPADVDVVELYDAFTINTILFLEDLGFCAKGEGAAFVEGGRIAPGGSLPVNTNGGGLSCVHPGMYGLFTIIEAVEQLSQRAGERQVQGARLAVAHGNGGELSSQATLVLGTEETL